MAGNHIWSERITISIFDSEKGICLSQGKIDQFKYKLNESNYSLNISKFVPCSSLGAACPVDVIFLGEATAGYPSLLDIDVSDYLLLYQILNSGPFPAFAASTSGEL